MQSKLAPFNWYVMLASVVVFAIGGTMAIIGAVVLSGHAWLWLVSMILGTGLYAAAYCAIVQMERF